MENIKVLFHNIASQSYQSKKCNLIKSYSNHGFIIVLSNGAMDGGWTLVLGVRGVDQPVDGDGVGRVVGLDGLARCHGLGAMGFLNARGSVPALDFSMPGARCLRWTCASILDQRTGLARCHPSHFLPPPPPSLASHASPLHRD